MKKRVFGRLGALVLAGVATSVVVAAIAIAAGGGQPPATTPPKPSGTPAGQIKLSDTATPFSVSSYQFGAGVGVSSDDPPQISNPSLSEFVFTKPFDRNGVVLLNALVGKTIFPKIVFTATWDPGTTLVYELTNAVISGDSQSSGGGQPSESFSVHFTHLKWTLTDASGSISGSA